MSGRSLRRGGGSVRLADADDDTLEILGLLFDALMRDLAGFGTLAEQLARMQVPILRLALSGPQFLLDRRHPARRFLGSVIEHAEGWLGDEPADAELVTLLAGLVERAATEFQGDASLFDRLCAALGDYHAASRRKAQLAERRHVDAASGRDRLDDARVKARAAVALRLARGAPSPLVRALLEREWTQVLALALAREGANGPMAASCLAAADRLIDAFSAVDREKGGRMELTEEQFLRQTLSIGLGKVGYHGGDLQLVLERLFSEDPRAHQDDQLPQRARAGHDVAAIPPVSDAPPSAREQSMLALLRTVPAGTWLELERGAGVVRRKLAWPSARGPCPLLNWRGGKAEEASQLALAQALAAGRARVLSRGDEGRLDRTVRRLPLLMRERIKAGD